MENRNGLAVAAEATRAAGTAEREAAGAMVGELPAGYKVSLRVQAAGCGRVKTPAAC
jgi:molybdopterin biosynthesis enzyme